MFAFLFGLVFIILLAAIALPIIGAVIGGIFRFIMFLCGFDNN